VIEFQDSEIQQMMSQLPTEAREAVDQIVWNYHPKVEKERCEYINRLFNMVSNGETLSAEDTRRLILNAMFLIRDNARLLKKTDEMVMELIVATARKHTLRF